MSSAELIKISVMLIWFGVGLAIVTAVVGFSPYIIDWIRKDKSSNKKGRESIKMVFGVSLFFLSIAVLGFLLKVGCAESGLRSLRAAGPAEVAAEFIRQEGTLELTDPDLENREKIFSNFEKQILDRTYDSENTKADSLKGLSVETSYIISQSENRAVVEVSGTYTAEDTGLVVDTTYYDFSFNATVYLVKKRGEWYVTEVK